MKLQDQPQEDLELLFRQVLPTHPTIETVRLGLPPPYAGILAASIRAESRIRKLRLMGVMDRETIDSIADMIRRNVPVVRLHVDPSYSRMSAEDCHLLCQAVARNTNLRELRLRVAKASGSALDGAVISSSPLRILNVYVDEVSEECVLSFARQLRTNTTLKRLTLLDSSGVRPSPFLGPIEEVLERYNVTLRYVHVAFRNQPVVDRLERRNQRIRRALVQLEPRKYRISPTSRWPLVFEMVTTVPTLLYRFLRRGNLETFCDVVLSRHSSTGGKKKRARAMIDADTHDKTCRCM